MASQFTAPILIAPSGTSEPLQPIPLSRRDASVEYDEAWLQQLLFRHPEALPIGEIDRAYAGAVPVCIELNTPAGLIDALYATPQGKLVVLEAKLWRNPEARRTVVGQILDYAKELTRWTYEDLQREVSRRTGRHGNALFDIVAEATGPLEEAAFIDEISRSLRQGQFLLLICGDGIREGVAMITDFLERHGTLQFTFGLVEMAVYQTPEGALLVQPRVLAQSLIVKRSVISLASAGIEVTEEGDDDDSERQLTELEHHFLKFWEEFCAQLRLDDASVPPPNPTTKGFVTLKMPAGSNSGIRLYCRQSDKRVGIFLKFARGELGDRIYARLKEDRACIDDDLGLPCDWVAEDSQHYVDSFRSIPDIRNSKYREQIMAFLADGANRYVNAFRHRIERIVEEL